MLATPIAKTRDRATAVIQPMLIQTLPEPTSCSPSTRLRVGLFGAGGVARTLAEDLSVLDGGSDGGFARRSIRSDRLPFASLSPAGHPQEK
jgi:hypothetical protein